MGDEDQEGVGEEGEGEEEGAGEKEAKKFPVLLKPAMRTFYKIVFISNRTVSDASALTSANGLLAAPPLGIQAHPRPRADQLESGPAQEVDLVAHAKHPAQPASVRGGLQFGA